MAARSVDECGAVRVDLPGSHTLMGCHYRCESDLQQERFNCNLFSSCQL